MMAAGVAAVTVYRNGLVNMSRATCDLLGWPSTVTPVAVGGGLMIAVDGHQCARPVSYAVYNRANGRFRCLRVLESVGLITPESAPSARYLALACQTDDGRAAVLVRPVDVLPPIRGTRKKAGEDAS